MSYIHKGRDELIWDGKDNGIIDNFYDVKCPYCQSVVSYSIKDITDLNGSPLGLIDYLKSKKIVAKRESGYELKKGIPSYIIKKCCKWCGENFWIVVGLKEIQPQRYNIFYRSTVFEIK